MKVTVALALCITFSLPVAAQHWRAMGRGTIGPSEVQTLYGDTVSDRLLAGGTFMWIMNDVDTLLGMGQAAWNGSRWDSIATRIQPISGNFTTQQTHWFLRFQGDLYACGGFGFSAGEGIWNRGFARLNEGEMRWEPLECVNPTLSGLSTLVPKEPQNTLYATGYKGSICGYPEQCVFRYDGSAFYEWEPFAQIPYRPGNYVGHVFDFRGKTYMSGSFRDPYSDGLVTFMRHNGTEWEYVPGWNTQSPIKEISIRNDTLYVGGAFRYATNGPGDLIAYFDGEVWNDMGGGMNLVSNPSAAAVRNMEWHNGELYVCGKLTRAGGIPVQGLAKWNGRQWCSLPGYFLADWYETDYISEVEFWRDTLYVCGGFTTVDGEPVIDVAQYLGGDAVQQCSPALGLQEGKERVRLSAFPNPARERLQLGGLPPEAYQVRVQDVLGREVAFYPIRGNALDVGDLTTGTYSIAVLDRQGAVLGTTRFVRE